VAGGECSGGIESEEMKMTALLAVSAAVLMADTRADFLKMIDRPRVPLAAELTTQSAQEGLEQFHFTYAADAAQRVPGLLVRPAGGGKLPVVIVLHGTGGDKQGQLPLLRRLARKGFVAIAIDGRYHGERSAQGKGSADYQAAMLRTYQTGREHPFLYDTVWDTMRLIDYVETLPGADASKIGLIGFSKGGMETYLAAAVDPRIKVAIPCIGVQSFRWALDNDSWQSRAGTFKVALDTAAGATADVTFLRHFYDKVAPGVYAEFDGPAMVPLIAPRPLLTINGEVDPRTPMPGLKLCLDAAKKAYAGAPDHLESIIEPKTGHAVTPAAMTAAVEWFERWLK
jgi:dienelactone hydrolase